MENIEKDFYIELPDFSEITPDGRRMLLEKVVKHNGIWKINKNDADPFPSNPHGDRIDEPEKLNLYTGEVISKINGDFLYKLPDKAMKYIYNQIMKSKEQNIINLLITKREEITYLN